MNITLADVIIDPKRVPGQPLEARLKSCFCGLEVFQEQLQLCSFHRTDDFMIVVQHLLQLVGNIQELGLLHGHILGNLRDLEANLLHVDHLSKGVRQI